MELFLKKFTLNLISGFNYKDLDLQTILVLLFLSLIVGKLLGSKRYIGFYWSTLFFFALPLLSGLGAFLAVAIIIQSPKLTQNPPKSTMKQLYWGYGLIVLSIPSTLGIINSNQKNIDEMQINTILFALGLILFSTYLIWLNYKFRVKEIK